MIDFYSFSLFVETWKMVCNACSDSVANLLSSAEGMMRSLFYFILLQRVGTIPGILIQCLSSLQIIEEKSRRRSEPPGESKVRGGDSHIKVTGVIVGNFEKNP